jgi:NitT/TauT family transport system substrate-binding protein
MIERRACLRRALTSVAVVMLWSAVATAQDAVPAQPEPGGFKMGIEPWLGYGQWHVAAAKDLFEAEGLSDVEIVNFTQDKDVNAALASGQLDGAKIATHTAMVMAAAGLPIKIVALLDVSRTADAIIAGPEITAIADLKGKEIAFEEGTTSHILLDYALSQNGMSIADVSPVPMPAADAGAALIAKRVPVSVTYEPYLTLARNQDPAVKLLYTAGENPGLVSDVLVVRDEVLEERPGQIAALLRTWDRALAAYREDTAGGRAIIAEAVGATADELATAFDGVTYYSMSESKAQLTGHFAEVTAADVKKAALNAGLLQGEVDARAMIEPRFVDAVAD